MKTIEINVLADEPAKSRVAERAQRQCWLIGRAGLQRVLCVVGYRGAVTMYVPRCTRHTRIGRWTIPGRFEVKRSRRENVSHARCTLDKVVQGLLGIIHYIEQHRIMACIISSQELQRGKLQLEG